MMTVKGASVPEWVVVHAEAVDDEESVGVWEVVVGHGGFQKTMR